MRKRGKNIRFQKKLGIHRKKYEQVRADIQNVDFICEGSLTERHLRCGNPKCHCHKDSNNLHGPYYQLSWKEKGKTVSRFLTPDVAELYREWINNRRRLAAIIDDMKTVSQKAIDCILEQKNCENVADNQSKNRKKTH